MLLQPNEKDLAYQQKKQTLLHQYQAVLNSNVNSIGIEKNTSNLFRIRQHADQKLDVKKFNRVISVDTKNKLAEIEGMTPYDEIVRETLKYNLLPTVVPELKSITIGGAISGAGVESSSFRYGLVHETIRELEILLGNGETITATSDNEYQDLFLGFPNTYGSLGYALKVKVKLIAAKKYIKLTHLHYNDMADFFNSIHKLCLENHKENMPIAYIDGVIFDNKNMFITLGEFVDEAPYVSNYKYLNIYYHSIQRNKVDYLTTEDYIWRWDSDWFWCSRHFFMENFLMRLLFGKFALHSRFYWKVREFFNRNTFAKKILTKLQGKKETVIQDVEIPIENAEIFLNFFLKEIGITPIWICPIMAYQAKNYNFYNMDSNKLYINFGFWDNVPTKESNGYYNRKIEKMVTHLNGHKSLYSTVFYSEKEFWNIFDYNTYLKLKNKYDPNKKLKDLYHKCIAIKC